MSSTVKKTIQSRDVLVHKLKATICSMGKFMSPVHHIDDLFSLFTV